jgi:D-lactate dehydrogenase
MKTAVFYTKPYDQEFLEKANAGRHDLTFFESRLTPETVSIAAGYPAVCIFVNDLVDADVVQQLASQRTKVIALRCAGYNNVDLRAAAACGVTVVRVPAYSPAGVAEHTIGLMLTLNRKFHRAYSRTRDGNFALDGLLGFNMRGKTVGVIGTGKIGLEVVRLAAAFGCRVLGFDTFRNPEAEKLGLQYTDLLELFRESDIVTLHCPLLPSTHHIINEVSIDQMKNGVMLINTSRGPLVDALAVSEGLKSGKIGYLGLDVYEEESGIFYEDLSETIIGDDLLMRLLSYPNVLITSHQAFFTAEALQAIAETTIGNLTEFEETGGCKNVVKAG